MKRARLGYFGRERQFQPRLMNQCGRRQPGVMFPAQHSSGEASQFFVDKTESSVEGLLVISRSHTLFPLEIKKNHFNDSFGRGLAQLDMWETPPALRQAFPDKKRPNLIILTIKRPRARFGNSRNKGGHHHDDLDEATSRRKHRLYARCESET
jgi:hypothetical protein